MRFFPPIPTPILRLVQLTLLLVIPAGGAGAASGEWVAAEQSDLRLVSAVAATGDRAELPLGLEFRMDPGWKIYWRTPGDAGLPPIPDWTASRNVAAVEMLWPVPKRFEIFDIGTLGYEDSVLFPLSVRPESPGEPVQLRGTIDFLICEEICIPGRAEVALDLPAGPAVPADEAHLIDRSRAMVPVPDGPGTGLSLRQATYSQTGETIRVALAVAAESGFQDGLDAFVEGTGGAYFDRPTVEIRSETEAVLSVDAPAHLDLAALTGDGLTVTLVNGDAALETRITPQPETADTSRLWTILALALLGGLILNLMPCVLPVLSLKLMSVLGKSGKSQGTVRLGFLAASAGIFVSFMVLAGLAIGLKSAGLSVGWGIQFQQPVFLALMIALLTLFACNMAGLFEFRLPGVIGDRAATAGNSREGLLRDFLTGAFATLLATPCSAPFLGTAVGFALSGSAGDILAIFAALAVGLALPYLAIAAFPGVVRFLPRPGRWMGYLRALLVLALVGTAFWLATVLATTVGVENAAAVSALAALAAAVLIARRVQGSRIGRFAWPLSALLALAAVAAPLTFQDSRPAQVGATVSDSAGIVWRPFEEAAIPDLVRAGKTVFVDVTADWCVTCQWNKKTVLEAGEIAEWLRSDSVVAMKADWTQPDAAIADYLARHDRYGIPFNMVYGPAMPQGTALPELLTETAVREAALRADPESDVAAAE
ncbi:MAG: protein-disulfide reductase DsbD family protein [Alphaproteobacteria bacterium]|nr:protein-disulfide reductase DsbD family protein [Alphaproteobacteria bacterium]